MPKNLGDNSISNTRYFGKGVFTDKCRIITVEDFSNYPKKPNSEVKSMGANGWQPELCLKLVIDSGIEMKMNVLGNYNWKTDPVSGKKLSYLGWKKAGNGVQNLIFELGLGEGAVNDDDSIAQKVLNAMPGKEFIRLRYCQTKDKDYEGKPSFQTWYAVSGLYEGAEEDLVAKFNKVSAKIKKYDPLHFDDYNEEQKVKGDSFNPKDFAPGSENEDII